MPDTTRQAIPTTEQLQAMAAGFGWIGIAAQLAAVRMVEAFVVAAQPMADAVRAFPSSSEIATLLPPTWRPLTRRTDPSYFGRKRRRRRARGRRIEAKRRTTPAQMFHSTTEGPGILTVAQWAAARRTVQAQRRDALRWDEVDSFSFGLTEEQARAEFAAETERWRRLTDPSLGLSREETTGDGSSEALPSIPDA